MTELFYYPAGWMVLLFFYVICLFITQATYTGILINRYHFHRGRTIIGEIIILVYIGVMAMTSVTVITNRRYAEIDLTVVTLLLYIVGALGAIYAIVMIIRGIKGYVFAFISIIFALPLFGFFFFGSYMFFYLLSITVFYSRLFLLLSAEYYRHKKELSAFSVKEGLDTLPAGVMFCDDSGYIYIINVKMQELILRLTKNYQNDSNVFWQALEDCDLEDAESQLVGNDILIKTPRNAWRFSKQSFRIRHTDYIEIIAIDVTESIGVFYSLEEESVKVEKQNEATKKLLKNMEHLRLEREYARIRSQVHDVLSQRITAIERMCSSENFNDYSSLISLSRDAIEHIKAKQGGSADELFGEIYHYYRKIGLDIELFDNLPTEENICFLFLAVLREACTNSIKHAGATKIFIRIKKSQENYRIEISNDGEIPKSGLVEGGGLLGIRNRVENAGGVLKVEVIPVFMMVITIPINNARSEKII